MTRWITTARSLTLSVLLPLALLFAQQGALLHEWSHWHGGAAGAQAQGEVKAKAQGADADLCLTCLGYAQIAGLAKFDVAAPPAPPALRYHFQAQALRHVADALPPATRNRGPPTFL